MKKAILIHGYNNKKEFFDETRPSPSNDHWFPWLQKQLLLKEIETQTPEMPRSFDPDYQQWKDLLEKLNPDEDTVLVEHSCGGGFLIRWLSENKKKVGKVILVAPWLDPEKIIDPEFFNFEIDPKISDIVLVYSIDDDSDILESVKFIKNNLDNVQCVEFKDKGHFVLNSLKTEEFPELLSLILE